MLINGQCMLYDQLKLNLTDHQSCCLIISTPKAAHARQSSRNSSLKISQIDRSGPTTCKINVNVFSFQKFSIHCCITHSKEQEQHNINGAFDVDQNRNTVPEDFQQMCSSKAKLNDKRNPKAKI
jgi:hypothetical protein